MTAQKQQNLPITATWHLCGDDVARSSLMTKRCAAFDSLGKYGLNSTFVAFPITSSHPPARHNDWERGISLEKTPNNRGPFFGLVLFFYGVSFGFNPSGTRPCTIPIQSLPDKQAKKPCEFICDKRPRHHYGGRELYRQSRWFCTYYFKHRQTGVTELGMVLSSPTAAHDWHEKHKRHHECQTTIKGVYAAESRTPAQIIKNTTQRLSRRLSETRTE